VADAAGLIVQNAPGTTAETSQLRWKTAGGIPVFVRSLPPPQGTAAHDSGGLRLHLELARLGLLRGFDQLLCLEGLTGVEHLPHQIETVRKVLRHFRGRVLLADEVGLGKTIEACLLLREYLLRGLARRVLILVPTPLVSQWQEELQSKFHLDFAVPPRTRQADRAEYWANTDRVLASIAFVKSQRRSEIVAAAPWDLVIVDEAHHCKNRSTRNWQLVNSLSRRHLFLLTATPVQNNLLELYNLLTLLEPGHLKTESDFKRQYIRRGNPRDPLNRERLRSLLGEVMVRNTRSLVSIDLPPRYAQTLMAQPQGDEASLYLRLNEYLRQRKVLPGEPAADDAGETDAPDVDAVAAGNDDVGRIANPSYEVPATLPGNGQPNLPAGQSSAPPAAGSPLSCPQISQSVPTPIELPPLGRKQLSALLSASGSHPRALARTLEKVAGGDPQAAAIIAAAQGIDHSAKDQKLLDLLTQSRGDKVLVFANFQRTLQHLQQMLTEAGMAFVTFSGAESDRQKDEAVEAFRQQVPVMLCSETGGEGRNLQFANTLVNYDLPWNPMRIEQRVGRIHRIGQTREVFIFNLCTAGSLESQLMDLLSEKIRMFELVVGEVGSILGNLEGGEEFETLVLNLWLRSHSDEELARSFDALGDSLLGAQEKYLQSKQLDEALFGEDFQ
jgi:SNF2 family DNA or RNA helicase